MANKLCDDIFFRSGEDRLQAFVLVTDNFQQRNLKCGRCHFNALSAGEGHALAKTLATHGGISNRAVKCHIISQQHGCPEADIWARPGERQEEAQEEAYENANENALKLATTAILTGR